MEKGYRINEIAKLFGLHPDTLRYYEEQQLIDKRISRLCQAKRQVEKRRADLEKIMAQETSLPFIDFLPGRRCYRLQKRMIPERDIDLQLKKLEQRHGKLLHVIGNRQGAVLDGEAVEKGVYKSRKQWGCKEPLP